MMNPLIAHNGLAYHVNLIYTLTLTSGQFRWFQLLFGNLVVFLNRINDEGIVVQFTVNVNEEISKYGRFKDVPTKAEMHKFLPIIIESDSFSQSDVKFIDNVIHHYIEKEQFHHRKIPIEVMALRDRMEQALKDPQVTVNNLVLLTQESKITKEKPPGK